MKIKNIILFLSLFVFATAQLTAQTSPVVSDVAFSIVGTTVTVTYDLADAEQTEFEVVMNVSNDDGSSWNYDYGVATGDVGSVSGTGAKLITWTYSDALAENFKIRILVQDKVAGGSPCVGTPTVTYGGKVYNTIQIGDQCWLRENLDIGTMISSPVLADGSNGTIEKYCHGDVEANCDIYGGLYNWDELMQGSTTEGVQGICPTGWHVPTDGEFLVLEKFMKAIIGNTDMGKTLISTVETNGTDISGFSALRSGYYGWGGYGATGGNNYVNLFTSSLEDEGRGYSMYTHTNDDVVIGMYSPNPADVSYAVRCIKD